MLESSTVSLFTSYQPLLFSLAYRMLGSVQDAEDIVQEVYITMNEKSVQNVQNVKAYLCKIVTNRCIDELKSARKKRETYVGPWLPEPIVNEKLESDPANKYVMKESISTAYLLLLEQLSETERAVFLLREVLQYNYEDIADAVGKTSANCRQIFLRAKNALGAHPEYHKRPSEKAVTITEQFVSAITSGDVSTLLRLLAVDAKLLSDGGGKTKAALLPILGAERIARFCMGVMSKTTQKITYTLQQVNGGPGMLIYMDGRLYGVISFNVQNEQIQDLYFIVNPEKLVHVKQVQR
ncbi:RNA polymerase sigma-70 factor [Fictibacillus barbaricus]|uniref:RNA polymerase sigma-70 factor (ECF subfamily) n=1 Tax=Fictibacillus barbaricus TaxID=182136 RepID=A0ABU1TWD1_9BACL|nr:RNA polymerase sigma-70 factor [Fictibacillus barbaricus]MDR7071495.1 RNA polymerase sigma-70 factor (ECF subfamily) [Fictibacillus barbaricus]